MPTQAATRPRILVADDHPDGRALLRLILERDGWSVRTAANGEEAVAELLRALPDVLLLDLAMPRMDGWAVLARVAVEPGWRDTRVIVMSADHRYSAAVLDLGASAFLPKPFSVDELRAALRS